MKSARIFKGSWFLFAIVAAIAVCEFVAWKMSSSYGFHLNPLTVAFGAAGIVAVVTSIIYEGVDIR